MGPFSAHVIAAMLAGFLFTLVLIPILRRPAVHVDLVDHPGGRKSHDRTVPLIGGLAMFGAFCVALAILPATLRPYASLVVGMALMLLTGVVDDLIDISAGTKLFAQIVVAVLMVSWGEVQIHSLGNLVGFGEIELGEWAIPFTVLCTLFMINAVNMADGTDGLAGGLTAVAVIWLLVGGVLDGAGRAFVGVTAVLLAVVIGFLCFNFRLSGRRQATVFMGDSGSLMLGFALAWLAVYLSQQPRMTVYPVTIAWILVLPVVDVVSLYIRRLMKGRNPFTADQEHLHHILLRSGYSVGTTVLVLIVVMAAFGGIGVFGWRLGWPEHYLFLGLIPVFVLHYVFSVKAWTLMRMLKGKERGRE